MDQAQGTGTGAQRERIPVWVFALIGAAVALFAAGLLMAGMVDGVARPWAGSAFILAMGLAAIVGLSKTSSA